jgi:RNA polymerase sigma-70 factor (ECF subfamily)
MENDVIESPELLHRARQLDSAALAQIYDLLNPGIFRYAMRLLGDRDLAEECVSETFSRLLHALHRHQGPTEHLQSYLYRLAHNWIVDHYRKNPNLQRALTDDHTDQSPGPEADVSRRLRDRKLRAAIMELTHAQQQVIVLKYLEAWENDDIALAIHKPVGAVKSLQHRALAALNKKLISKDLL